MYVVAVWLKCQFLVLTSIGFRGTVSVLSLQWQLDLLCRTELRSAGPLLNNPGPFGVVDSSAAYYRLCFSDSARGTSRAAAQSPCSVGSQKRLPPLRAAPSLNVPASYLHRAVSAAKFLSFCLFVFLSFFLFVFLSFCLFVFAVDL